MESVAIRLCEFRVLKTLKATGSIFVKHQQLSGSCVIVLRFSFIYLEALRNWFKAPLWQYEERAGSHSFNWLIPALPPATT